MGDKENIAAIHSGWNIIDAQECLGVRIPFTAFDFTYLQTFYSTVSTPKAHSVWDQPVLGIKNSEQPGMA